MSRYPVDSINHVRRREERGHYDHATVHALLDSAVMCHVAYVLDGQPFCTPTLFWREGHWLYWHGSNSSRMLRNQSDGEATCLTVTHLDSLVLARCGFNHSADYRSVMAFGHARLLTDHEHKRRALVAMVDRFFAARTAMLRPTTSQEINATSVVGMEIERASAKIRAKGVADDEADYELPVYAERLPVYTVLGAPEPCPRRLPGVERPAQLAGYRAGRRLDEAVSEAQAAYAAAHRPTALAQSLVIREFDDTLAHHFRDINLEWIEAMYQVEPSDRDVLGHPRERILDRGGAILFVEAPGMGIVGACALARTGEGAFELTKMGVRPAARGLKAGEFLLGAVIARAGELGATLLYLLSNRKSAAAIHLYEKLGFEHDADILKRYGAGYARCDVAMRYRAPAAPGGG